MAMVLRSSETSPLASCEPGEGKSMRISHPIRLGIAWTVIASGSFLCAISAGASTLAVTCPVTRWDPPSAGTSRPPVGTGAGEQLHVTVGPLVTDASEQIQVTVRPLVFITVVSGGLQVSTTTGRPPATRDEFYLMSSGRADHAPAGVVEAVLRSCR